MKPPAKQWRGRGLAKALRYSSVKRTDSTAILKEMRRPTRLLQTRRSTEKERDPIKLFRENVLARRLVSESELKAIGDQVAAQIDEAVKFAEESPYPDVKETYTDVYVSY